MIKIMIATPCYGWMVSTGYLMSLISMLSVRDDIQFQLFTLGNESLITRARNICVANFLASDCTHLLFIDADIQFDKDVVYRLLNFDKDVVCACYPKKSVNWCNLRGMDTSALTDEEIQSKVMDFNLNVCTTGETYSRSVVDGFIQVDHAATGFMLIKRKVFDDMRVAYPEQQYSCPHADAHIQPHLWLFFDCAVSENKQYLSEDFAFCEKWRKLGGDIWMDVVSPLTHIGTYFFSGSVQNTLNFTVGKNTGSH